MLEIPVRHTPDSLLKAIDRTQKDMDCDDTFSTIALGLGGLKFCGWIGFGTVAHLRPDLVPTEVPQVLLGGAIASTAALIYFRLSSDKAFDKLSSLKRLAEIPKESPKSE
ncbi:MAG: hypothetical protein US86_C0007G0064 [Candidatus Daviesbacteria bacterium GW2011_GWA2_38_24]|uniref:Uncharacterized protein n=1 Tax=Candidatus Daviesbacteria bacterium GW2011_GWA2_38_24 TaxID=1618422 RepID=A0A0G0LX75_9BACT|nr:MAG: hypothetical protein US86_C0007G0064 [Candidatus Daviesbacteria bacterium GW2011_GWA2_38_24]KKQ80996.1 MAG: hypothetical protein UT01_C0002G0023 [Candidatus Daviesbacteria bacterium GW2011_GWA1_38_7]OGE24408.1 MAG: hypothetical protein A2688_04645 [Candidatus Daviesbacteria bacterium RIFCSPHIGHO2_01_FULL_38_8]